MEFKKHISNKFLGLILILCITKVCHGQLMCYVCEDCAKVSIQTPKVECNEDFFNAGGSTSSSTQTTTEPSTTESDTTSTSDMTQTTSTTSNENNNATSTTSKAETSSTTTSTTESTTDKAAETTTPQLIETTTAAEIETTKTTEEQPPTPPTVGPPKNTTAVPTPPTPGTLKPLDDVDYLNNRTAATEQNVNKDEVENVDLEQGANKTYKPSAEIRLRHLRSVSDVSFHCFKVKATTANGTMIVNRGCSRVQTNESVCGQWQLYHPLEKMNKCYPCSHTICNGSSALSVSITALFVTVIAVFLRR